MRDRIKEKRTKQTRRKNRSRSKIYGTHERPRLAIKRSLSHIYAQVIDDEKGLTIAAASDLKMKSKGSKMEIAHEVGKTVAKEAQAKKIKKVVFDRGGNKYHGRVKALAEGAREGGLEF